MIFYIYTWKCKWTNAALYFNSGRTYTSLILVWIKLIFYRPTAMNLCLKTWKCKYLPNLCSSLDMNNKHFNHYFHSYRSEENLISTVIKSHQTNEGPVKLTSGK